MAHVNMYIQLYAAVVLAIILVGNLQVNRDVSDRSVRVFYVMLFLGVIMLFAGGWDSYLLIPMHKHNPGLESLAAGISDLAYFLIIGHFTLYLDLYDREKSYRVSKLAKTAVIISFIYGIFWFKR